MGLVLEDDADPAPFFGAAINRARNLDFDVFKFEGAPSRRYAKVGSIGPSHSVVVRMTPSMGAAAYLITKAAAQRCCSVPLDRSADEVFGDFRLGLKVLETEPFIVTQDRLTPRTVNIQNYGLPPASFRRSVIAALIYSARKRWHIATVHGLRTVVSIEMSVSS
jgi:hypothetical protein